VQAGPSAIVQAAPTVKVVNQLNIDPSMTHLTLRDWFEMQLARELATR
jgi:hypothetical protein